MKTFFTSVLFLLAFSFTNAQEKNNWTLQKCISHALKHNISIQKSELDIDESKTYVKDAKGNFLPNLNANIRHSWNTGLNVNPLTNTNVTATTQSSNFGIAANVTLFDGLKNTTQLHKSNLVLLSKQYQLDDMKDNISLLICNGYLQILFNKETLKTLETQLDLSLKQLKNTNALVANGIQAKGEILEIEANIADQEKAIISMENAIEIAKLSLFNLLQLENFETFDIAEEMDFSTAISKVLLEKPEKIYQTALGFRSDVKISQLQLDIFQDNLKIAKSNYIPTLTGSFGFNTNYFNSNLLSLPNFSTQISENKGHAFALSLNIPIFNRFAISNDVKRNKIYLQNAELDVLQTKINLKDKVFQAYSDAKNALKNYEATEKLVNARKVAYTYSKEKFEVGLLNSFDFNQSKIRFENSETELIKAKYDCIFKQKILEYYFGIPVSQ